MCGSFNRISIRNSSFFSFFHSDFFSSSSLYFLCLCSSLLNIFLFFLFTFCFIFLVSSYPFFLRTFICITYFISIFSLFFIYHFHIPRRKDFIIFFFYRAFPSHLDRSSPLLSTTLTFYSLTLLALFFFPSTLFYSLSSPLFTEKEGNEVNFYLPFSSQLLQPRVKTVIPGVGAE